MYLTPFPNPISLHPLPMLSTIRASHTPASQFIAIHGGIEYPILPIHEPITPPSAHVFLRTPTTTHQLNFPFDMAPWLYITKDHHPVCALRRPDSVRMFRDLR